MRQRNVRFQPKRMNGSRRLSAAVSLAVSLILWLSPFVTAPVAAAPPGPIRATSGITLESRTGTDRPLTAEKPQLPDQFVADIAPRDVGNGGDGSVRLAGGSSGATGTAGSSGGDRRQEDGKSAGKPEKRGEPDPGDGPVRKRQETAKERRRAHERSDIRIWPMPAKSYTFSQHFGCVPQLGNLYFPGEGCPAAAR